MTISVASARQAWIVPSNPATFLADEAFSAMPEVDWSEAANAHIHVGDLVLLYTTSPVQAITQMCLVVRTGIPVSEMLDDAEYWTDRKALADRGGRTWMRLRLVETFSDPQREYLHLDALIGHGLSSAPQGRVKVPEELAAYIDTVAVSRASGSDDSAAEVSGADAGETASFDAQIAAGDFSVEDQYRTSKTRGSAQAAFARAVKGNYGYRCAVTGITTPEFLVASHIVPWADDPSIRLDPRNGICLSTLVDRAFDTGYLTIDE